MNVNQVFSILSNRIKNLAHARFEKVEELPENGEFNIIYLVPKSSGGYTEHIWLDTEEYEDIGSTDIDLSQYATVDVVNTLREQLVASINAESLRAQGVEEDLMNLMTNDEQAIEDVSSSLIELENEVGELDVCIEEHLVNGGVGGYRKYSNGHLEQWGVNTINGLRTINLFTGFKDTSYTVIANVRDLGNFFCCAYPISNNQFNCRVQSSNGYDANIQVQWRCFGRWK